MNNEKSTQCAVISDLMVLYTLERTSPETKLLVENHLQECPACAQAFRRELQFREQARIPSNPLDTSVDNILDRLKYLLFYVCGVILYGLSWVIQRLEKYLHKVGLSTFGLKIRIYRARRWIAGAMLAGESSDAQLAVNGLE